MADSGYKTGIIYIAENKVSGKCYVGQTVKGLSRRRGDHFYSSRNGSNFALHAAIRKYGEEAFVFSVLQNCCSRECLNDAERWWIAQLKCIVPNGYNLTDGGDAATPSEETRKKMSEAIKKRMTPEMMRAFSDAGHRAMRGTKWSPERHAIRRAWKTPDSVRLKMSIALRGKVRSEEALRNMSAGKKGIPRPDLIGNKHAQGNRGRALTEEHKRNISEAKKGKPRRKL